MKKTTDVRCNVAPEKKIIIMTYLCPHLQDKCTPPTKGFCNANFNSFAKSMHYLHHHQTCKRSIFKVQLKLNYRFVFIFPATAEIAFCVLWENNHWRATHRTTTHVSFPSNVSIFTNKHMSFVVAWHAEVRTKQTSSSMGTVHCYYNVIFSQPDTDY